MALIIAAPKHKVGKRRGKGKNKKSLRLVEGKTDKREEEERVPRRQV